MRIAIIKNAPVPNIDPLLEALGERPECQLMVVYEADREAQREWKTPGRPRYRTARLRGRTIRPRRVGPETFIHLPRRSPLRELGRFGPDVVVASGGVWSSPANVAALAARRRRSWAFVPWWGEFRGPGRSASTRLVEPWKRVLVSAADGCLAYSDRAARDAVRLGAAPEATVVVPNVSRGPSQAPCATVAPRPRDGSPPVALYVGQLNARKGVDTLLDAFSGVTGGQLWIAGAGPLEGLVRARAARDTRIRLLGHLGWEALEAAYRDADVHVLPSRYEVWGLVVNEAGVHGLPSVVSDQVAAGDHLVVPGVTGEVFPAGDAGALRDALARTLEWGHREHAECARTLGERLSGWTADRAADAVLRGCGLAVARRGQSLAAAR